MKCPICKKDVEPGSRYAPFCSERCRTIDLGNWAAGKYRVSTPMDPAAAAEEQAEDDEDPDSGSNHRK